MPFTVTQPLGRVPSFAELQALAGQHGVQIHGDGRAGEFFHLGREQSKVSGNYRFEPDGRLRGEFIGNFLGKLAGTIVVQTGKAEVTITAKPFLLLEAVLKAKLAEALAEVCAQFTPESQAGFD
jgi:hypothetical protein